LMDVRALARYPFLKESGQLIKSRGIGLEELVSEIAYDRARQMGKRRVLMALEKGEVPEAPLASEHEALLVLLSYPVARMLVASIGDSYLSRRYALSEAVSANSRLQGEDTLFLVAVARELGVDMSGQDGTAKMHFADFLRYTNQMRSKEWKLINQDVAGGYVLLQKGRAIRVVQNAIQKRLEAELESLAVNDLILKSFADDLAEIKAVLTEKKSRFKAEDLGKVRITRFPPCMYQLLAMVQAGENVPHTGRFAIVSFMHNIGMSNEGIFNVFASVPDFDERKTGYQIEHITGRTSSTEYTPPECATMKSYGLCPGPDTICLRIKHPLSYYRLKAKYEGKRGGGDQQKKSEK